MIIFFVRKEKTMYITSEHIKILDFTRKADVLLLEREFPNKAECSDHNPIVATLNFTVSKSDSSTSESWEKKVESFGSVKIQYELPEVTKEEVIHEVIRIFGTSSSLNSIWKFIVFMQT